MVIRCGSLPAVPYRRVTQVHNALGFAFFNMDKVDAAIDQYRKAVDLQPGYVTGALQHAVTAGACQGQPARPGGVVRDAAVCGAWHMLLRSPCRFSTFTACLPLLCRAAWNNLGDAYERKKDYSPALAAYREVLTYAPDNKVAQARSEYCRTRIERTA